METLKPCTHGFLRLFLTAELQKKIPLPSYLSNDANCAALGKVAAGAKLGHTVLVKDGELCTYGKHGYLEAYASASALNPAKQALGNDANRQTRISSFVIPL